MGVRYSGAHSIEINFKHGSMEVFATSWNIKYLYIPEVRTLLSNINENLTASRYEMELIIFVPHDILIRWNVQGILRVDVSVSIRIL